MLPSRISAAVVAASTILAAASGCARSPRAAAPRPAAPAADVAVPIVSDEADAVLDLLRRRTGGEPLDDADWARLFATEGYVRLKAREAGMGRPLTDSAFRAFVLADTLAARLPALERALREYKRIDVAAQAARALRYLPPGTPIRARLYLQIKPRTNSFVYAFDDGRAIFLYVDPATPRAVVERDVVAHELHHIGFAAACETAARATGAVPAGVTAARRWAGAFGEGLAMLAAAGGPDAHPHADSPAEERARWERDLAAWPADLRHVERFLLEVAAGRLADPDSVRAAGMRFFGDAQGAWYTVGYAMAVTIERALGRERLVAAACDPGRLLAAYNDAARARNRAGGSLPLWSDELLRVLGNS